MFSLLYCKYLYNIWNFVFGPRSWKYFLSGSLQKKFPKLLSTSSFIFWSLSTSLSSCPITLPFTYFTPITLFSLLFFEFSSNVPTVMYLFGLEYSPFKCKHIYSLNFFQVLFKCCLSKAFSVTPCKIATISQPLLLLIWQPLVLFCPYSIYDHMAYYNAYFLICSLHVSIH